MDLFEEKRVSPMLIAQMQEPFNDDGWIYELKLDGCRCIGYFDQTGTCLRNKRNMELLPRFPELKDLHRNPLNPGCHEPSPAFLQRKKEPLLLP